MRREDATGAPAIFLRRVADRRLCEALLILARGVGSQAPEWIAVEDEGRLRFLPLVGVATVAADLDGLARRFVVEAERAFGFVAGARDPWTLVSLPSEVRRSRYEVAADDAAATLLCRVSLSRSRCVPGGRGFAAFETNVGDGLVFPGALACEEHAVGTKSTSLVTVLRHR